MNHNQTRFAQLTGNSQIEFTQAWDELVRYATDKAKGYFDDGVSRDEAVDEVMSGVTAWLVDLSHNSKLVEGIKNPWGYIKKVIYNHLKKLSKGRDYRPSYLESASADYDSEDDSPDEEIHASEYRAFIPIEKEVKTKDSIIFLYTLGLSQAEIVRELEVDKAYVSRTIKKYPKEIEELKTIKQNFETGYKVD